MFTFQKFSFKTFWRFYFFAHLVYNKSWGVFYLFYGSSITKVTKNIIHRDAFCIVLIYVNSFNTTQYRTGSFQREYINSKFNNILARFILDFEKCNILLVLATYIKKNLAFSRSIIFYLNLHDFMKCIITICLVSFCFFNESYKYNDISIGILCCIAVGNHHSQSTVDSFTKKNNSGFQKPAQYPFVLLFHSKFLQLL